MYEIAGFVGDRKVLNKIFADIYPGYIVALDHAPYALVPIAGKVRKDILEQCQINLDDFAFKEYPVQLEKILDYFVKSRRSTKLAYVAAEYFGGMGSDFGYVFDRGKVTIFDRESIQWPNSNISMALKAIGVPENLKDKLDAFDVVGLGRSRRVERWVS